MFKLFTKTVIKTVEKTTTVYKLPRDKQAPMSVLDAIRAQTKKARDIDYQGKIIEPFGELIPNGVHKESYIEIVRQRAITMLGLTFATTVASSHPDVYAMCWASRLGVGDALLMIAQLNLPLAAEGLALLAPSEATPAINSAVVYAFSKLKAAELDLSITMGSLYTDLQTVLTAFEDTMLRVVNTESATRVVFKEVVDT